MSGEKPKKILFIIDNLSTGGAQRQMVQLAVGLKHRGYDIEIFCYQEGDLLAKPLYEEGIPVIWYEKKSRFSLGVFFTIRRLINQNRYDLIISFLTTPNFYAVLCGKFMGRPVPVIVSERRADLPGGPDRMERFARSIYRYADHVVVNSHHQREDLSRKHPWLEGKITTIYNGFDLKKFNIPARVNTNSSLNLLVVASVGPYKNGLCLVEALKIMRDDYGLKPKVDWIGQQVPVGVYGEYLDKMNRLISEYSLQDQWNWLGQRTDVIEQMHSHDVLIHPSYVEGLPNVVCEALASSLPVIVSNTLDHPLLVQHNESGFLFDFHNPVDLAERIVEFNQLGHDDRKRMGECGRRYAEGNLASERFISEYENLITRVLQSS
ncbi:MAG: glycosyltransferase family 4 protein [Anaerolineaceae bacterium]